MSFLGENYSLRFFSLHQHFYRKHTGNHCPSRKKYALHNLKNSLVAPLLTGAILIVSPNWLLPLAEGLCVLMIMDFENCQDHVYCCWLEILENFILNFALNQLGVFVRFSCVSNCWALLLLKQMSCIFFSRRIATF